ncbi:MAG: molybdopterin/thiamine biosynthesis adenylyltransferase [Candidatus Marinamargulisbacteria bacterium]|jgi:molybdopterin/thiamine biosynthesis adenylyltransferase
MNLKEEQIERYSRHIILKDVGGTGQEKLLDAKVLVIGAGGLGAPVSLYLAAAGVGTLGLIDGDVVDLSNLQRQVIHYTEDIGRPKVISAKEKIERMNPDVTVKTYQKLFTAENAFEILEDYDFVIDGTDSFPSKFLINDACVLAKKPFSHGGILRFDGQTLTHTPGHACYRCVFQTPPPKGAVPTCSQAGILGAVAGILGTIQAAEALRYLIGIGDLLTNRLLVMNAMNMKFRTVLIKRNPKCAVCGDNPTITELAEAEQVVCDLKGNPL